jgi:arylsulfatase A
MMHVRGEMTIGSGSPRAIIVIMADDLGYGDLGRYNFGLSSTPAIDSLIDDGLILSQHYSAAPVCAPARAAFLTGRYSLRTGAIDTIEAYGHDRLALDERTVADAFSAAGWTTGMIGKWHNGAFDRRYHPTRRGFHEFAGFSGGWQDYYDYSINLNETIVRSDGKYLTHRLTDEAIGFIRRHRNEHFLLCMTYNAPHYPFEAPELTVARYRERNLPIGLATLYAMVEEMDRGIGQVLHVLEEERLLDDCLILFTSDNGPQFGGQGEWSTTRFNCGFAGHKGTVHEGGIRVPAIVRWPGRVSPGSVSHQMCHFCDWLPTFCDLAGIATSADGRPLDGRSIAPTLLGSDSGGYPARFWQWNRFDPVWGCNAAMRDGDWKLVIPGIPQFLEITEEDRRIDELAKTELTAIIRRPPDSRGVPGEPSPLLYHLGSDPLEQNDLSAVQPSRVASMASELKRWFVTVLDDARRITPGSPEADRRVQ